MTQVFQRGDSSFHQLNDGTFVEHDAVADWTGVSRYQHGLASGRPSPEMAVRPRAVTTLLSQGGMLPSHGGPGQGMLFEPETSHVGATLAKHGVPERRPSSGEGFLPRLGSVATAETDKQRQKIAESKAGAIRQASTYVTPVTPGNYPELGQAGVGTSTPLKTQMENRAAHVSDNIKGNWYDEEAEQVEQRAAAHGVSHGNFRRATADLSPNNAWSVGHPAEGNFRMKNLDDASHVARSVKRGQSEGVSSPEDLGAYAEAHTRVPKAGSTTGEVVMPTFGSKMRNAGRDLVSDSSTPMVAGMAAEKVPNFDLALAAGDKRSSTVRREAAQAYTVDTHDSHVLGAHYRYVGGTDKLPEGAPSGGHKGQYDIAAMTGRRAGLKAGMLPSEMQQHVWRRARPDEAVTTQKLFGGAKLPASEREARALPGAMVARRQGGKVWADDWDKEVF